MKKIMLVMLLVAAVFSSCRPYNPPYGPYGTDPYGPGRGYPTDGTEPGRPDVSNPQNANGVFDDYANRYNLVTTDGSVYVSTNGTLVWYNKAIDRCPKLCWMDVCIVKDGYNLEVYWYKYGVLYKEVLDARQRISFRMGVLLCHPSMPDYSYQSRIKVINSDGVVHVTLLGEGDRNLESFKM